ncbi:hypothetical protein E2K98_27520 [Bacillus salipaludis]|uniref:Uncharacterized protein n=1 Tax=Bacillus salipaludis TaxID=2547811 RepID=A0A4R5VIZ2_9BACI|nr:hypothetical protein [Bacillus salipaludis]MDQ6595613.1 hypothetical protein [Bacillus salipaludis]TDK56149.1 hypothetical protein E2K98_27520 [Bacillus salipaludis]
MVIYIKPSKKIVGLGCDSKNKSFLAASIILSLGIVLGCSIVTFKPFQEQSVSKVATNADQVAVMMNINEASKLLGLKTDELKMIISAESQSLTESGEFSGTMLPYIVVNGKQYFERTSLLKWAVESSVEHRGYNNGSRFQ